MRLDKKVAIVTGGASGMGRSTVERFVREGASVVIADFNTDTGEAVDAIGKISTIINKISDFQNTIASAVEQQTSTTCEISINVSEAALGSAEIAQNITQVVAAAESTAEGAGNMQMSAHELARMAADLRSFVEQYRLA